MDAPQGRSRRFVGLTSLGVLAALAALAAGDASAAAPCAGGPLISAPLGSAEEASRALRAHYVKYEYRVPMRDGAKLYTVAYVPRDRSRTWPVMLMRTPYGVSYGVDNYPMATTDRWLSGFAPSRHFIRDGFILVNQDVRGRMMSEGTFVDVRPRAPKGGIDEATDAYDTIEYLVKHLPAHNGRVGVWGISYPGFYAAQAAIDAHPALKAVSPQAPVTNWFLGDDFRHNGAFFLQDALMFFADFGKPRPSPTKHWRWDFEPEAGDAYELFLSMGPLANAKRALLAHTDVKFWDELLQHGTYDAYWKARDPRPHYRAVKPAVLVVGGLFDAENLWGALQTYRSFDAQSPGADVRLVMGPWRHGGWSRTDGDRQGDVSFEWKTSPFFLEEIQLPFFQRYLKDCREERAVEAWVFQTGTNLFERHPRWPPPDVRRTPVYLTAGGGLSQMPPATDGDDGFDEWVSDPARPVPYRGKPTLENDGDYVVDDQRFASRRPDVVVHSTPPLPEDLTVAGPIDVTLWVSTTGTDADFVVKVIDVYPADRRAPEPNPTGVRLAGYEQLVRAEVFRGRFRESFERPVPFAPGVPARVRFSLPDINHSFRTGHRLMVHIQSSWFPLVDRNPQTFVDIATAKETDFVKATHRVYFTKPHPSALTLPIRQGRVP